MKSISSSLWRHIVLGTIAAIVISALAGCGGGSVLKKKAISVSPPSRETPQTQEAQPQRGIDSGDITVAAAEAALNVKDMPRAEIIATRLLATQNLSQSDVVRASRVLALSAAACRHPYVATGALERWKNADPDADTSSDWQNTYAILLRELPPHDADTRARSVVEDEQRPYTLRYVARLFLTARTWDTADPTQSLAPLAEMYSITRDNGQRAYMERSLFSALHTASPDAMQKFAGLVTEENAKNFPAAVIALENIRRLALTPEGREPAEAAAKKLAVGSTLADASLLQAWDSTAIAAPAAAPIQGRIIVLALPLSGPLKAVGERIADGATEAVKEFGEAGYAIQVTTIDTQDPAWLDNLTALPPNACIVGGPLHTQLFEDAHRREITRHRAFMTFTPSLGETAREGVDAWRFFSSPEDQVNALLAFGERMGLSSYSILAPANDEYARAISLLFTARLQARGSVLAATAEYPVGNITEWHNIIKKFVATGQKNRPPSEVVFLPDVWRNMDTLGEFIKYEASTQILMGTSSWGQGLANTTPISDQFAKAVYPGPWKRGNMSPAASRLASRFAQSGKGIPGFWAGLGYDFVRFASTLPVQEQWTAASVNSLLSRNSGMEWSVAPITWSETGTASQHLFLFSPEDKDATPLTPATIEARFGKPKTR